MAATIADMDRPSVPTASFDALLPPQIAAKAADLGVAKAGMDAFSTTVLAVLAGAFIGLGASFATVATTGAAGVLPFGVTRLLAGVVFSLGLILVVVAGAELFTGNNLIVIAWADRRIGLGRLLRNWVLVYAGNLAGAVATALLVYASGQQDLSGGAVGANALAIAHAKSSLGFGQALALGALCNALVCLAVWLSYAARSLTDKVMAVVFPITAFVALGFEHSVANMYFLTMGLLVDDGQDATHVTLGDALLHNLLPVTLGNIVGGSAMVGLVYWAIYLRRSD